VFLKRSCGKEKKEGGSDIRITWPNSQRNDAGYLEDRLKDAGGMGAKLLLANESGICRSIFTKWGGGGKRDEKRNLAVARSASEREKESRFYT